MVVVVVVVVIMMMTMMMNFSIKVLNREKTTTDKR
jgi:hypothetical protein